MNEQLKQPATVILVFAMLFLTSLAIASSMNHQQQQPALAVSSEQQPQQDIKTATTWGGTAGVYLKDIHTDPNTIHVGDTFRINATVVNNSPNAISFSAQCQSPLSATFDKQHVSTEQTMVCMMSTIVTLDAGKSTTISGPDEILKAKESGTANGLVTFTYIYNSGTVNIPTPPQNGGSQHVTMPIQISIS